MFELHLHSWQFLCWKLHHRVFTNVLYAALLVRMAFFSYLIDKYPLISLSVLLLFDFTFLPRPLSIQPTA